MEHSLLLIENQFKKLDSAQQDEMMGILENLKGLPWANLQVRNIKLFLKDVFFSLCSHAG